MIRVVVGGMTCEHCARHVREALEALEGVRGVRVSLEKGEAEIEGQVGEAEIRRAIEEEDYEFGGIA